MKRILALSLLVLAGLFSQAHAGGQFKGLSLAVLNQSSMPVASQGGGGPTTVIIASDTFARIPSSGSFLIGSTTTADSTKQWRALYGTARTAFNLRGSTPTSFGVIGGSISAQSSAENEAVFIETTTPPTSGYKVVFGFVKQSSSNVTPGVFFQGNTTTNDQYFAQPRDGSVIVFRTNGGTKTQLFGIPFAVTTSTPSFCAIKVDITPGNNVTLSLDMHNDGSYEQVYVDTDVNRLETIGVAGILNYYADNATTRVIKQIWVENAS